MNVNFATVSYVDSEANLLDAKINAKQDTLVAGNCIDINTATKEIKTTKNIASFSYNPVTGVLEIEV